MPTIKVLRRMNDATTKWVVRLDGYEQTSGHDQAQEFIDIDSARSFVFDLRAEFGPSVAVEVIELNELGLPLEDHEMAGLTHQQQERQKAFEQLEPPSAPSWLKERLYLVHKAVICSSPCAHKREIILVLLRDILRPVQLHAVSTLWPEVLIARLRGIFASQLPPLPRAFTTRLPQTLENFRRCKLDDDSDDAYLPDPFS